MTARPLWPALRLGFGLLALTAIGRQLAIQIELGSSVLNFFSYFTNLSNLFAAVVLMFGASRLFTSGTAMEPSDRLRAVSAVNMTVVGIVFAILLRNVDLGSLLPWINSVLHYIMPCVIVLDWLLQPPRIKLDRKLILQCLIFPAIYLAYVLVRGSHAGWYPYPFLNPSNVGGYSGVAIYAVGIGAASLVASWSLVALGNKLGGRDTGRNAGIV